MIFHFDFTCGGCGYLFSEDLDAPPVNRLEVECPECHAIGPTVMVGLADPDDMGPWLMEMVSK